LGIHSYRPETLPPGLDHRLVDGASELDKFIGQLIRADIPARLETVTEIRALAKLHSIRCKVVAVNDRPGHCTRIALFSEGDPTLFKFRAETDNAEPLQEIEGTGFLEYRAIGAPDAPQFLTIPVVGLILASTNAGCPMDPLPPATWGWDRPNSRATRGHLHPR
jgi:hypothetical protein